VVILSVCLSVYHGREPSQKTAELTDMSLGWAQETVYGMGSRSPVRRAIWSGKEQPIVKYRDSAVSSGVATGGLGDASPTCPKDRFWDSFKSDEKLVSGVGVGVPLCAI